MNDNLFNWWTDILDEADDDDEHRIIDRINIELQANYSDASLERLEWLEK